MRVGRLARGIAPVAVVLGLLSASATVPAQEPVPVVEGEPAATEEQIRDLIARLEDPDQRARLIADLEALLAAQPEPPEAETEDAFGQLLQEVEDRTAVVRVVARTLAARLDEVPDLVNWLEDQLATPRTREIWLEVGFQVLLVLAVGTAAHLLIALAFRRMRDELQRVEPTRGAARLPRAIAWLLLQLVPVLGFGVAAYGTLVALELRGTAELVALPLIYAVLIVRTGVALLRTLFAPKAPALRVLPLAHDAARYGLRWSRRLLATAVYGYFALVAADALGLPWTLHGFLQHVLFFIVAVMIMVVIVRCREPVAATIASLGDEGRGRMLRRLPWASFASVWHILALLYVLSVYVVWALRIPGGFRTLLQAIIGSAAVAVAGWLLWRALEQVFSRDVQVAEGGADVATGIERRATRYLPVVGALARALVIVGVALALLQVWGFGTLAWLFSESGYVFLGRALTVVVIVLLTLGVWELISLMIERSITDKDEEGNLKLSNRTRTILNITRNMLLVFLSLIALFLVLSELGLDIAPLLAGAGVIGIAIGFGSQKLVQDIITGMFILLGDTIRVGDVIEIAGRAGVVEQVSMRTVALRDLSGNVHTIPYSAIDTVSNFTKDFSYGVVDLGVAYRENVDEVIRVLRELGEEMNRDAYFRRHILEPLEVLGVDAFADSAVIIKTRFKTRPLKQWEVAREFRRRIKNRFDELGIEIPYPHQTVYFGVDKEGRAPPARVELQSRAAAAEARAGEVEPAPQPEAPAPAHPALARGSGGG